MRIYWVIILVCGLLLIGCEKETVTSTEQQPAQEAKPTAAEQVQESASDVAKQATELVEAGTQLVKDSGAAAEQAVKEVVATVTEDVTAAVVVAKEKTAEIVNNTKQQAVEVKEQLEQEGSQLISGLSKSPGEGENQSNGLLSSVATLTGTSKAVPPVQISEIHVIETKNGNVSLTHAEHGKLYGCTPCHGDATPGAFDLGKDTAHALCKDCHKEQGGPIKCSGCHKK